MSNQLSPVINQEIMEERLQLQIRSKFRETKNQNNYGEYIQIENVNDKKKSNKTISNGRELPDTPELNAVIQVDRNQEM